MEAVASQRFVLRGAAHGAHGLCEVTLDRLHLIRLRAAVHTAATHLHASTPSLVRALPAPPPCGAEQRTAVLTTRAVSQDKQLFDAHGPLVRCVSALPSVRPRRLGSPHFTPVLLGATDRTPPQQG